MARGHDWFGLDSIVVITARDSYLLERHRIERTHEWFKWNAFKNKTVDSSYDDILNCALVYASGLPLALEVLGSNLYGKHIEE